MPDDPAEKPPKKARKGGRKKWQSPPYDQVKSLAALHLRDTDIALVLGISLRTLYRKKRERRQFSQALRKGKAIGIADAAADLRAQRKAGSVAATIFTLKAMGGWKETAYLDVKLSGAEDEAVKQMAVMREKIGLLSSEKREQLLALLVEAEELYDAKYAMEDGGEGVVETSGQVLNGSNRGVQNPGDGEDDG